MVISRPTLLHFGFNHETGTVFLFPKENLRDNVKKFEQTCNDLSLSSYIDYLSETQIAYTLQKSDLEGLIFTLEQRGFTVQSKNE